MASTLSTHYNDVVYKATDSVSAKPDFSILIYPVISMENGITHQGSRTNLLGSSLSIEMINNFSNEKKIDASTPKTFIVHATDDQSVPVENSINYYLELKKNKISAEMHLYEKGGHGFGTGKQNLPVDSWETRFEDWLKLQGFLN